MKDPAIHIKRSDLLGLISKYGLNLHDVNSIMKEALKSSIRNRINVTTKAGGKKKADRHIESDTNLVSDFNRLYSGIMIANNIKTLTITKTSIQYLTLKEVTSQALEFSKLFELAFEHGFNVYINLGIKLLGNKFSLYRLKGIATKIVEYYRDTLVIQKDPTPDKTTAMEKAWEVALKRCFKTYISYDFVTRVHFVYAKNDAESMKALPQDWIDAQFEKWSYLNNVPQFTQLYGDNAKLIYQTYMATLKKENTTIDEQAYFKQVKNATEIPIKAVIEKTRSKEERLRNSV